MRILILFVGLSLFPWSALASTDCPLIGGVMQGQFERMRWLDKAARELRGGRGLTDDCLTLDLLKKTDGEIVDYLLAQPEFADTALDFNLHFLGFRRDYVRETSGEINPSIFDFPSALNSAREVLRGGDFFKLLEFEQPLFLPPLRTAFPKSPGDELLPPEENRQKHFAQIQAGLQAQIQFLRAHPDTTVETACSNFLNETREGWQWGDTGMYIPLMDIAFKSNIWYGKLIEHCVGPFRPNHIDFVKELEELHALNARIIAAFAKLEPKVYTTKSLNDIQSIDVNALGLAPGWHMFGTTHRLALQNSSTNFNRKRAAYVLSRFFCDDLTPINVEASGSHSEDRHASEASCMACHYKLDPMAGYFRDFGILFASYKGGEKIRFDDNAGITSKDYQRAWAGKGRVWNVGFIRSSTREDLNVYGEGIEDLFRTIRTEPEVKRCMVKRMFEFFVNDSQAVDAGYVEHLTEQFIKQAKVNSTEAFKQTAKEIVLARSFRESNPDPEQCYDYAPGYNPEGRPPCKVAFILEKNCASCHDGTHEHPYLDLTSWKKFPDGKYGFVHVDKNGASKDRLETFEKIMDRLSSENPRRRMPLRRHMDPLHREVLYKWANGILNEN